MCTVQQFSGSLQNKKRREATEITHAHIFTVILNDTFRTCMIFIASRRFLFAKILRCMVLYARVIPVKLRRERVGFLVTTKIGGHGTVQRSSTSRHKQTLAIAIY